MLSTIPPKGRKLRGRCGFGFDCSNPPAVIHQADRPDDFRNPPRPKVELETGAAEVTGASSASE